MSNADPIEVKKFERVAETWWDMDGEFRPLHLMNPVRCNWIDLKAGDLFGKKHLDVGCGGGVLCEALAAKGTVSTGIDAGATAIAVAKQHVAHGDFKIDYHHSTAEEWASEHNEEYDLITCMEMLEHVPDPGSVITALLRMLKPGGQLFLSTINRNPKSWAMAIVGAEFILKLLPPGTHDYKKFIKPSELAQVLRQQGAQVNTVTGLHYNPLNENFSVGGSASVNYLLYATKRSINE